MKVAVIGATGNAGPRIIAELLRRGHHVRAIVRPQDNISSMNGVQGSLERGFLLDAGA